ncbi:MAG: rod shape-determining protein MreC [Eggerthellaceae bacterium]|jgi:rod shape-determining protein MreC|nr:rod shape-determining protein MreC [Eggerthellaceae bacterium]
MALNFQNQGSALLRRVLFAVLLVISLASMTVYAREGADGPLHRVQAVVAGAVAPARSAGAAADAALDEAADAAEDAGADESTLTALREQNDQLRRAVAQGEEYRLEAQRLQALLNLKDAYDLEGVGARVIGRSTDAWNQTITIDAGADEGVETGMTVMGPSGVAGQVVAVSPGSSTVRLLSDPASGAAALIQSSRAEGIVRGSLDGLLYLENIGADVTVSVGDVVLTSGLGGSYVRGLLIGTVARVDGAAGDATRRIVVAPGESIRALEEVMVVFKADSPAAAGDAGSAPAGDAEGGA